MVENNKGFGTWVLKYRFLVIIVTLIVVVLAASGLSKIRFSNDYRYYFSKENPQLTAFEAIQNTYTKNDNVLFAVAPKDGDVFTRETLEAVEWLTKESWQIPYSLRVDSVTNFQYTHAENDDLIVEDLVRGAKSFADADLKRVRDIALAEPLLINRIISPKGHVTGVNVTINLPGKSLSEVPAVGTYSKDLAARFTEANPGIDLYITGMTIMNNTFSEASQGDMQTIIPLMFLVIIIVMALLVRSLCATFSTVIIIVMSAITAMGLAGWLGIKITPSSAAAPTIIITLAVADSIHILITMLHNMREGLAKREAIIESLRINLTPVFLTSITTVIGFMSMNFSDAPPFRDLGNIVAMGVVAAFFYSVFFLPAFVSLLPVRCGAKDGKSGFMMERLGNFVVNKRRQLFWGTLVVIVILTAGISRIEFNDMFVEYFDERYQFRTDTDYVTDNLTGIYMIEYSLGAGETGGVSNPEYLEKIEEFAGWYRKQNGVLHVNVLTDVMKRLNKNMHADDEDYYKIPEERDLAAQYLLLYELSLPYGLDLNNQINVDKSATRFSVTMKSLTVNETLALERSAQVWLRENAPKSMFAIGTSPTVMFSYITERNVKTMIGATFLALFIISIILMVALRSFKIGAISLIPNLIPAITAFGLWGLTVGQVGLGVSVVAAMSLGIVVDDTVHFLSKYLRARREHGFDSTEAVRYSFRTVGTALWVTSMILVAGFGVLTFSGFGLNSEMGLLTAISLVLALMADFLFLPPLLMKLDRGRKK